MPHAVRTLAWQVQTLLHNLAWQVQHLLHTIVWQVQHLLHTLRSADEEMDLSAEAEGARVKQLSLGPLYAKPPPIWVHPAFGAEFGDPFIAGTGLEVMQPEDKLCERGRGSLLATSWSCLPSRNGNAP